MEIWVLLSLGAAIFQTLRFVLQKFLSDTGLGVDGATFSRFIYSAPILLVIALIWFGYFGYPTSLVGSFFWFWAFSLVNAALVKAVGQIELLFSILASTVLFKEKITLRELFGIFTIMLSVLGVIALS